VKGEARATEAAFEMLKLGLAALGVALGSELVR